MSRAHDVSERIHARFANWARALAARNQEPALLVAIEPGSDPPRMHVYWPDCGFTDAERFGLLASLAGRYLRRVYETEEDEQ